MSLKEQRYVCTLAEYGSVTEAAKQLYIMQPALSMFISTLEKSMDVQLFDRNGKNLQLTYAGKLYVEKARQMIALQDELEHTLEDIRNEVVGRVKIGLQRKRSSTLTTKLVKCFKQLYPHVELQFTLGEWSNLLEAYNESRIDILVYNDQYGICPEDGEILANEKVLLIVPSDSPLLSHSRSLPGEIYRWIDIHDVDEPFILPPRGASLRNDIEILCRQNSYRIKHYSELQQIDTAMQLAAEGMCVCFSRESFVSGFSYDKMPASLIVGDPILTSSLCMKYNHGLLSHDYFVCLLDVVRQCISEILPMGAYKP